MAAAAVAITAAIGRDEIADYVNAVFIVYIALIFIRILLSWVPRLPDNAALLAVVAFVRQTTDPVLNQFRRFLPPVGGRGFALDLSPILVVLLLLILQAVVVGAIST